ncbi:hypothetical protein [Polyangium aurulentum]|uniref:hypothetical protein n=1 Tax=Polyangium aurulentum TaxID=2567896 RepID=UPI0010ADFE2A|nr:hypothetical protein [Polyangium aurulentum]UQA57951.1 hypothetical protein E8A73_042900 [Polyangium aurulentum]
MRLPPPSAHYSQRVRYGRYVARRLRRTKRAALAADVEAATNELLKLGRAVEDADQPVQEAMADRDGADDDLDLATQNARAALAGRSADAIKRAPYTLVFPEGIAYYTAAPLDQETIRYGELRRRLEEHLPADDSLRKDTVATLNMGLDTFSAAMEALGQARTEAALAETRLAAAEDAWGRLMTKIYGSLLGELGRAPADRFFPKVKSVKKRDEETD